MIRLRTIPGTGATSTGWMRTTTFVERCVREYKEPVRVGWDFVPNGYPNKGSGRSSNLRIFHNLDPIKWSSGTELSQLIRSSFDSKVAHARR